MKKYRIRISDQNPLTKGLKTHPDMELQDVLILLATQIQVLFINWAGTKMSNQSITERERERERLKLAKI